MKRRLLGLWSFVSEVLKRLNDDNGAISAAAVSYYILLSIVPLLVLAVAITTWIVPLDEAQQLIIRLLSEYMPGAQAGGGGAIDIIPQIVNGRGAATGLGVVMLFWSATAAFVGLEASINFAFDSAPRRSVFAKRFIGALMMAVFGAILGLSLAVSLTIAAIRGLNIKIAGLAPSEWPFVWDIARFLLPLAVSILAFTAMYKIIPTKKVPMRIALFGGLVAGALFELAKQGFGYYVVHFAKYSALYGSLTSIIVFTIWLNYSALVAILGAETAATLHRRQSPEHQEPSLDG